MNKAIAGYHMLVILSQADGEMAAVEGGVIVEYLRQAFPFPLEPDSEIDILVNMEPADYMSHFMRCMNDFYESSTYEERISFLDFAAKLVGADKKVSEEENRFLKELFDAWDSENAE